MDERRGVGGQRPFRSGADMLLEAPYPFQRGPVELFGATLGQVRTGLTAIGQPPPDHAPKAQPARLMDEEHQVGARNAEIESLGEVADLVWVALCHPGVAGDRGGQLLAKRFRVAWLP